MEFSRQEYWSGLSCPPPGDLPDPGIESASPTLADSLDFSLLLLLPQPLSALSYTLHLLLVFSFSTPGHYCGGHLPLMEAHCSAPALYPATLWDHTG